MSINEFEGIRAVVTGGASGIGAATTEELRLRGADVTVVDLVEVAETDSRSLLASVTDSARVVAAMAAANQQMGGLDVVVNSAGIGAIGTVEDATDEEWRSVLDVNVIGTARVCAAAMPYLRESRHASIVNVCSIAATAGLPQRAVYSASKGAVLSLTRAMAADYYTQGVRVNCVCPGTVDTPWVTRLLDASADAPAERSALEARQPLGRLGIPSEIAYAIAVLASPRSSWTTGVAFAIDGGMSGLRVRHGRG